MIKLNPSRILQAVMAGAIVTSAPACVVGYNDKTSAAYDGDAALTNLNGTTAVTVLGSPASGAVRQVDYLTLRNHDSVEHTFTLRFNESSTLTKLFVAELEPGEMLGFTHASGWYVCTADGSRKSGSVQDLSGYQLRAEKDATDGYVGKTGFTTNVMNALGTVISFMATVATAPRTYLWPDKDGTVAMTSDVISVHSGLSGVGTNTHAQIDTALTRLANTSGNNTGDQDLSGYQLTSQKGQANGYAPLDGSAKIASAYLPSFVDDVVEAANFAALPGTGETGKIYVTLDDNKPYRWSGSAYVEISASPGSTDAVTEGATNKYFTEARVRATMLTGLDTGVTTQPPATDSILTALGKIIGKLWSLATVATSGSAADLGTGTLPAGRLPALTGDITSSAGSAATTLATVNSNVGSFTNANITLDAKGRVLAAANGTGGSGITIGSTAITSGTSGRLLYDSSATVGESANLTWDQTNKLAEITGTGSSGAVALRVKAASGTAKAELNDNGTLKLDSDASSGALPIAVHYNGGGSPVASVSYTGTGMFGSNSIFLSPLGSGNGQVNVGGGVLWLQSLSGSRAQLAAYNNLELSPSGAGGSGTKVQVNSGTSGTLRNLQVGTIAFGIAAKTADYTATIYDGANTFDCTGAARTVTLPALSATEAGQRYVAQKIDSSGNALNVDANGSETINGSTSVQSTTTQWGAIEVMVNADKSGWTRIR